ncbi:MAG: hypothetical protein WCO63_06230 [Bacteroidota bacterium]
MNAEFLKSKHLHFEYELKSGTSTSYYQIGGTRGILPSRIGITRNTFAIIRQTGRGHLEKLTGQVKSTFKKEETSIYKKCKPFWIHSSLYEIPDFPVFLGYGDIGFTSGNGKTEGTGDLLIIHSSDQFQTLTIHIFMGLLFHKDQVIPYLKNLLK